MDVKLGSKPRTHPLQVEMRVEPACSDRPGVSARTQAIVAFGLDNVAASNVRNTTAGGARYMWVCCKSHQGESDNH
jgi:hypothetical protein